MISLKTLEVRKLDQIAQDRFGIPGILLMEHASLGLATHIQLQAGEIGESILILCGKGNNGGDGLAAARHLFNRGYRPEVLLIGKAGDIRAGSDAAVNAEICLKMGIPLFECDDRDTILDVLKKRNHTVYVDAVFGTGLSSELKGIYPSLFNAINELELPFMAVDVPSGLNSDTGIPMGGAVKARKTITFAFAKEGFQKGEGPSYCGEIKVVDIGLPKEVIRNPHAYL